MKLCLTNIGKIKTACVDINGITVIAGNNDTGKSTIGKALFAMFNSLYRSDEKIVNERVNSIENLIDRLYRNATHTFFWDYDCLEYIRNLLTHEYSQSNIKYLKKAILDAVVHFDEKIISQANEDDIARFLDSIEEYLRIDDDVIFKTVLQRRLDSEFNEQVSNQFASEEESEITLIVRNEQVTVHIENNSVLRVNKWLNLGTETIYIDDPFALDEIPRRKKFASRYAGHRDHLLGKLSIYQNESNVVEELVATNKLNTIYTKISSVCPGDIVKGNQSSLSYKVSGIKDPLKLRNLSTGLKTFVILKMLLLNGSIEANGTIILDEPEIHLHPAWQLLFAELIVLLHCEFGLHILLNTHSPYFLNAIEVYSVKYGRGVG